MSPLSVDEARRKLLANCRVLDTETLPLSACHRRVAGFDLIAPLTQPPFSSSAMDGYAVRAVDVCALPATVRLIGESAAGHPFDCEVGKGEAVRIFTGAVVPTGSDLVVIQEDCEALADNQVLVKDAGDAGKFVRPAGFDFFEGECLISTGTVLSYRHLGLIASMNQPEISVRRKPRVAIIATGDELVVPGSELAPGQIVSSIPYGMAALIDGAGGEAVPLGIARDDHDSLEALINKAQGFDILVTIGGASVGDHDLVQDALKRAGMELDFWQIAMRPGKPLMVGSIGDQRVVGVPGNPVSALICCALFVVPLMRSMLGIEDVFAKERQAVLTNEVRANGPRQHYMRASTNISALGQLEVTSLEDQDSSLQAVFANSNALIMRPPQALEAVAGEHVTVLSLDGFSI